MIDQRNENLRNDEVTRVKLMQMEFAVFKHSYPNMTFIECAPRLTDDGKSVQYPTKEEYLKKIKEVISISHSRKYFGLYYSGVTDVETANWVVFKDGQQKIRSISSVTNTAYEKTDE